MNANDKLLLLAENLQTWVDDAKATSNELIGTPGAQLICDFHVEEMQDVANKLHDMATLAHAIGDDARVYEIVAAKLLGRIVEKDTFKIQESSFNMSVHNGKSGI